MNGNREQSRPTARVAVFGATGHTARFVTAELLRRGHEPVLVARDAAKLEAAARVSGQTLETRVASIDDPASLDDACRGVDAIINCAGPFLDTAPAVIEAGLRLRVHYLDLSAEQASVRDTFERYGEAARDAGIVLAPGMAFYGALADLLATALAEPWAGVDELDIGIALDSWKPTPGTRLTGKRNTARRLVVADGRLAPLPDPPPARTWTFPAPFASQEMIALPFSEIIAISRHLPVNNVNTYINRTPIDDIRNPATPPPMAADERGRSDQVFALDIVARKGPQFRRAVAQGRDIYAITAPIVVEAAERILAGRTITHGAAAAGELFDARDFLQALSREHLSIEFLESADGDDWVPTDSQPGKQP